MTLSRADIKLAYIKYAVIHMAEGWLKSVSEWFAIFYIDPDTGGTKKMMGMKFHDE